MTDEAEQPMNTPANDGETTEHGTIDESVTTAALAVPARKKAVDAEGTKMADTFADEDIVQHLKHPAAVRKAPAVVSVVTHKATATGSGSVDSEFSSAKQTENLTEDGSFLGSQETFLSKGTEIVKAVSDMLRGAENNHSPASASRSPTGSSTTGNAAKLEVSMKYNAEQEQEQEIEISRSTSQDLGSYSIDGDSLDPDVLNEHTDPFAVREGSTLIWRNVNMTLPARGQRPERKVLQNCWGEVPKRETTAIMGASGAGKTSLLNILAGRLQGNKKLHVEADVRLNNYTVDPTDIHVRQFIAFVAQDDSLHTTSTPREAIRFSAKMRLPRSTTNKELDLLTNRMLEELGLNSCADTLVGGVLIKGISGGERKRTSVGVELVTKPSVVFLDEPTSGLDSFSAVQCCEVLRKVAKAGASVLFTIHQPASEIFESFDHLILMNKGRVMYQGSVKTIPSWFGARGHPVPRNYNPADWVIDIAQGFPIEELEESGYFPPDEREIGEAFVQEKGMDSLGRTIRSRDMMLMEEGPINTGTQIWMLFKREMLHIRRDWTVVFVRVFLVGILSSFIGMIFLHVGEADQSKKLNLHSQFGALMILLVASMMSSVQISLFAFPEERPVFLREYSTKHYSVISYFTSHLVTEAVVTAVQSLIMTTIVYVCVEFHGSFIMYYLAAYVLAMATTAQAIFAACLAGANTKLALQMTPLLFAPQMLFAGFFVSPDLMPKWLQWVPMVCTMTYSTRILVVEEFSDCNPDPKIQGNCDDVMDASRSDPGDVWWYWLALLALFAFFRCLALLVLQRSATVFY